MNIIKRLTAVTSLTVFVGALAPATIAWAKTSSTNDSQMRQQNPGTYKQAVGFSIVDPSEQADNNKNHIIFGNSLLEQGDQGPSVTELQDALRSLGYYNGNATGTFDALTTGAVQAFQTDRNITSDGIVGAATKTALYDVYRNTDEAKSFPGRIAEIQQQEKKAAEQKAARAKAEKVKKAKKAKAEKARKTARKAQATAKKVTRKKQAPAAKVRPVIKKMDYKPKQAAPSTNGRALTVVATSYALGGRSATGVDFSSNPGAKVIAVDPGVIPLGSRVNIPGYGVYIAADTGGSIKGNRIDIHLPTKAAALNFGRQTLTVQVLP
ncbi:3D domain-containing protein [Sporolactobacillus vineae]|uniref:3D domain-containing protein n=1 Tax=Sporolactobacillus vineae TaxID=444463 RepID=UPI00028824BA|nr:3D domain-containing protein [Sporolactobacillus vineae]